MPLSKLETLSSDAAWALWHIEETIDTLKQEFKPTYLGQIEFEQIHHPQKQKEWLASRMVVRYLVQHMNENYNGIYKDAFGKPHLRKIPFHISIAHCFPYAVGAINKKHPIGIDIERPRVKLLRIRDRFLNPQEISMAGSDLDILCKFWTSKEVLYKIYGRKKLIFREHINVKPKKQDNQHYQGVISYQEINQKFDIHFDQFQGHFIAYSR